MTDGYLLNMRVFDDVGDGRGRALERDRDDVHGLIDGCLDAVQAIVNLLAAVGATQGEVDAAIRRMDERNCERGRL